MKCMVYSFTPHFYMYILKIGCTDVNHFFLIFAPELRLLSLEPQWQGGSKMFPQTML